MKTSLRRYTIEYMTAISKDEVARLATLSNVGLDDAEIASLQKDLATILHYVDQLKELDTTGVEPTYDVHYQSNVTRQDVVSDKNLDKDVLLGLAPEVNNEQIKVPKVL